MAFTYGTVTNCKVRNGQTRKEYECRLGYEVQSQSIANNTSSVKLKLQCRSISSSYNTKGPSGLTSKIDGTTVKNNAAVDMSNTNTWQNFGERTITVTHNSNGTYSASKSGSFTCTAGSSNYSLSSGSASVTVAPATIPRYATSNQSLSGRTSYSIIMNWSSDSTIDYVWYSKDNGASWVAVGSVNATSGSYTISGLSSNTTYNIKTRVRRKDSQLTTDSATTAVTTHYTTTASVWLSSKTETSITVASSSNVTASSTLYRIMKSGGSYGSWQTSATFSGLTANTTYYVQVEKVGQASGEAGYATTSAITTYDYPKPTSINNFTIGDGATVNVYNPLRRTYTLDIIGNGEKIIGTYSGNYEGAVNGEFKTADAISKQYASIPESTSGVYYARVKYGSVTKYLEKAYYYTKGNEYPTFTSFSYEDTYDKTLALTDNPSILVSGYSNLKVKIPVANKAYSDYYSPIDKYRLNVGNMSSVEVPYKSDAQVELTMNKVNSPSITVTAIDKRGYPKAVPITVAFKAYFKPVITSLIASRGDGGVGSQVTLSFNGTWWNDNFGKVPNTIKQIEYYYKRTIDNSWTKGNIIIIPSINGNNFSGDIEIEGPINKGFDVSTAYNVKMVVTDELDSSTAYQTTLGTGTPAIAIWQNNVSVGQKYDENLGGVFQVRGEAIEEGFKISSEQPEHLEKIWIKNGKNRFYDGLVLGVGNCEFSNGIVTQTTADTNQNPNWKMQAFTRDWDYIRLLKSFTPTLGRNGYDFVKTSDFNNLQLGVNGSAIDTVIFIDVAHLENDKTYTISFDVTSLTQGKISWKDIQIERSFAPTSYQPHIHKKIYYKNESGLYEEFMDAEDEIIKNGNGTAIKRSNGILEVFGRLSIQATFAVWSSNNSIYSYDHVVPFLFPFKFIETPTIITTVSGGSAAFIVRTTANKEAITQISIGRPNVSNGEYIISYIAKGRWK